MVQSVLILVCVLVLASSSAVLARTWHVKPDSTGDAPTIQAGLDSAATGDTVLVAPGYYPVKIIFWPDRNGIVLAGAGAEGTVVVGDAWQTVLYIADAVTIDTTTVIRGLTLRNGGDAGIILYGASPLIDSCRVDSCRGGPGVYAVYGSGATIRQCLIEGNAGPGIRLEDSDSTTHIIGSTISGNSATSAGLVGVSTRKTYPAGFTVGEQTNDGGGVHSANAAVILRENDVLLNTAASNGGGIYTWGGPPPVTIIQNMISGNSAGEKGGGISCGDSSLVTGNTISGNTAGSGGGLVCTAGCTISENTISENVATRGGGIYLGGGSSIAGNVMLRNTATVAGGAIYGPTGGGVLDVCDNMILKNSGPDGGGIYIVGPYGIVRDNTIAENTATSNGGGIRCGGNLTHIIENAIVRNLADGNGGGIYLSGQNPTFSENTITENDAGGLGDGFFCDGTTASISFSNMAHNRWAIYNIDPTNVPVAQDNWWGESSGPWHQGYNPGGQGDSLSAYAWDFQPWLTEADTVAPPSPPIGLNVADTAGNRLQLSWEPVPLADLAGYKLYFDSDTTGFPYSDTVDVGNVTLYTLDGLEDSTTYYVAVTCQDRSGEESWYSAEVTAATEASSGVATACSPTTLGLDTCCPNPFISDTRLDYFLPRRACICLRIYDVQGRLVRTLVNKTQSAGRHSVLWDGTDMAGIAVTSGVYYGELCSGGASKTARIVLIR